ncbi:MAG: MMPL family transporter [Capnocytophaga sp.]|nr:MMPL family transporter [Capnocytophaga sp.]
MTDFFYKIALFIRNNKIVSGLLLLLIVSFLAWKTSKLHFEEDINRMLPKNSRTGTLAKALSQLDFADKIIVLISLKDSTHTEVLTETAEAMLDSLHGYDHYIKSVQGKYDETQLSETFDFIYDNLPLFLTGKDYENFRPKLAPDSIAQRVEANYRTLISPSGMVAKPFITADPLGLAFVGLDKLKSLGADDDFELKNGFVTSKDGQHLLLFIEPIFGGSETEYNTLFVNKMNILKDELNNLRPQTEISYFGSAFIAVANAHQIKTDILTTVIISMSLLLIFLAFYYKNIAVPFLLFVPTALGALTALAFLSAYRGTISAISVSVGAILLGVTIDYSLHILTHLKKYPDKKKLYASIAQPTMMSSLTTAISFLCLLFVESEALKDLGLFASVSVVSAAIFALILIPLLYKPNPRHTANISWLEKAGQYPFHRNKALIIICIALVVFGLFTFRNIGYNNNLSDLNYVPAEIQSVENQLERISSLTSKSLYAVAHGNSEEEVLQRNNQLYRELSALKSDTKIINFSSSGTIFLSNEEQKKRIGQWNDFWQENNPETVQKELIDAGGKLGFKPATHKAFYELLGKQFQPISITDFAPLEALSGNGAITEKDGFYTMTNILKVSDKNRDFVVETLGKNPDYLLIDRQQLNEAFLGQLKDDFNRLVNYSLLAVLLVLFVFFRRLELALTAALPIVLTAVAIGGLMFLFGLELNIFSTIVCTLVFGIGVDFSIFMTSALRDKYTDGHDHTASFRTSMLLAALTTIASIGSLIFAKHPALKSISATALLGIISALLITFVLYPLLFGFFITNRPKNGKSPITLKLFLHSMVSFAYYALGGLLITLFGTLVMAFIPNIKQKKLLGFKKFVTLFTTSVLYSNPFVRKSVLNPQGENFTKPAVIIANHTSFLDTLAINMTTHKIVYLVNDWVYNSPIFRGIARIADYYPVSKGVEESTAHLQAKVGQGLSLMVFPESTRSYDQSIKRFHKGAFFLSEIFKLDILPIYIHGNSETLPKGDYIIYDGSRITVEIGERIAYDDARYGTTYSQRSKSIRREFEKNFKEIRNRIEQHDYFNRKITLGFLYKSDFLYSKIRNDLKTNSPVYYQMHQWADTQHILHIADDYGQVDSYLALFDSQRKIHSHITDTDKRNIAKHNYISTIRNIIHTENLLPLVDVHTLIVSVPNMDFEKLINDFTKQIIIVHCHSETEKVFLLKGFMKKETFGGMVFFIKI